MINLHFATILATCLSSSHTPSLQTAIGWVTQAITLDGNSSHTFATGVENVSWVDYFSSRLDPGEAGFGIGLGEDGSSEWNGTQSPWGVKSIHLGKCAVAFTWNPGPNNLPKPTKALLRVFSSVGASLIRDGDVVVANGLGSPVIDGSYDVLTAKSSTGTRIAYFENTDPTFSLNGLLAAAIGPVNQMYSHASASLTFDISSIAYPRLTPYDNLGVNYRADGNGGQIQNRPNADGEHALDLAASPVVESNGVFYTGTISMNHNQEVYDSPFRAWECSSEVASTWPLYSSLSEGWAEQVRWTLSLKESGGGLETTNWTVQLTDKNTSSHPKIPSGLTVRWHKPYENPLTLVGPIINYRPGLIKETEGFPVWPNKPGKIIWEKPGANAYLARQIGSAFEKISDLGIPIISIITGWIGGGIAILAPEPQVTYVENDAPTSGDIWSNPDSTHIPNDNRPRNRYVLSNATPHYESIFKVWLAESYDGIVGYVGRRLIATEKPTKLGKVSGVFEFVPSDGGDLDGGEE